MPKKSVIKKSPLAPTILIAGGAGFIGSHLCETLLQKDARVVVLDNFKTGKENYIGHLVQNPKFAVYNCDISKGIPEEIESVDYILHLAGLEEYLYSKLDINLDSLLTNALGTKNLLDLANRSLAKFLLVSTTDVYQGMISQIDLKKYFGDTDLEEKQYSQTEAKRFAEALVWEYYKKGNNNVRIVRVPEVFGPRMDYESTGELGRILKDVTDNKDLTIYGEGTDKQYYLYITDAVSGILKALFNSNTDGKIFPLVGSESYSPLEIVFLLKSLASREMKIDFRQPFRQLPAAPNIPDTSSLKDLDWEPKISFKEGVIRTLKWGGYEVNENSFKPGKILEDIKRQKQVNFNNTVPNNAVSSLVDTFDEPESKPSPLPQAYNVPSNVAKPVSIQQKVTQIPTSKVRRPLPNPFKGLARIGASVYLTLITLFFVGVVFIGIPAAQTFINAQRAVSEVTQVKNALTQLDSQTSQESAKSAYVYFTKAQRSLKKIDWLFDVFGKTQSYVSLEKVFASLSHFSKFTYNFAKGAYPYTQIWNSVQPNNQNYLSEEMFKDSAGNFATAKENLQFALSESEGINPDHLPNQLKDNIQEYKSALHGLSAYLQDFFDISSEVPTLLGVGKEKKYLVLFQNSNEIRPTGGFIGSYATVVLDRGKLKELNIDDIYNPDGQIDVRDIQVTPPAELAEFLKEDRAYIRNSNWDPDFTKSSDSIAKLFKLVTGDEFDGVIAINLRVAESLLKVTGPVFLTAYNEEISAANMYERAQFHSEFNYEEGVSQKKSFLTVLGSKLLERVFSLEPKDMPLLFEELNKLVVSKDVLVYLPNTRAGTILNKYGWDGTLKSYEKDYLYVVNSNVGGTKANYFVKNSMNYQVSSVTRDGVLRGNLALTYEHTGKDSAWPGGPYTNYVRVYVPAGSKLTGANLRINNSLETDLFKEVTETFDGDYKYFGYLLKIEPSDIAVLTFKYDLDPATTVTKELEPYNLVWQKQPGTFDDTLTFGFDVPFGVTAKSTSPNLKISEGKVSGFEQMDSDEYYTINFK